MGTTSRSTLADGARVAGRYRIERMLGRGGSATVYCAIDDLSGADVAIKHLLADAGSVQHALFQREYHTLAQLRHPAVISVFDYGVTPDGPFYTMELLDGHDLSELAPLPWVEACRVLCEVASALAILHSRRLIHRDVSHRNVRVASDGRTKLIDFGAMAPMGFVPDLIGTPPFVSPEAAYREPLDQRTDLYSLGALACWLLSGRHLYPAQTIRELRAMWATGVPPVAEFPPDVPAKLQQLALALMQRDVTARPSSAAEVIDRLIAIAGLPPSDSTSVASSYLINPKLIGRQFALDALKAELHNARAARRGGVLLIRGSYGAGKSRLLQEAVMQAQFAGFTVMQTGAHASASEPYAVIGRIVEALLQESPDVQLTSERREVLAWMNPALRQGASPETTLRPTQAEELRARVHAELVAFVIELAASQRLLIAIDDLHACDEESLAVLLGASRERARGPLILGALLDQGATGAASVRLLCERAARVIELRPLSVAETELLVESLFGSSPHSPRVAGWMHEHSRGNPLECMELARHLVERRAAYYMDGAWMLPSDLPAGVPSSLLDAFHARVAALPAAQRAIAELLALYGRPASLALCIELCAATLGAEHRLDDAELFRALDQLVSAELLLVNGDRYAISRDALREALLSGLSPERRRELHQRIAVVLIARGPSDAAAKLEAGHHAMCGDSPLPGVALLEEAIKGQRRLGELGEAVVPALQLALELCEQSGEPPARCMRLRARLVNCAVAFDKKLIAYADPLLEQLRQDSGLAFWPALEGAGRERLTRAIALAQQHHERTAPERRGLPPIEALTELAMVASAMLGVAIFGFDGATIDRLAEVVAPFEELDKKLALTVVYDLVILIQHIGHGRLRLGHTQRVELLERLRDPSSYHGMPEEARKATLATQLHALGMWQAPRDGAAALATADAIDALQMKAYEGAALQIRLIVHLYAGNAEAANACQLGIDSLALRGGPGRQTEIWLLAYLVGPYAAWGDVIALKRTAERFAALVPDSPAYRAHMYIALGAYYRERGQLVESKRALEHALALALSRTFGARTAALSQYIETLIAAGEHARALELANRYFGEVEDDDSERAVFRHQLLPLTALAEARLGAVDAAAQQLDAAIAAADTPSRSMAWRVRLHEARARVAIEARDAAAFEAHAERVAELLRTVTSTTLLRHRMLLDDGARIGVGPRPAASPAARPEVTSSMPTVQERRSPTAQELARRADVRERCERALALLLGDVRALGGVLFADGPNGLEVMAKSADEAVSTELLEAAQSFADTAAQVEQTEAHAAAWTSNGGRYELFELQVPGAQGPALVGVAALRLPIEADHQTPSGVWLSAIARALQEAVELSTGRPFEAWMEM